MKFRDVDYTTVQNTVGRAEMGRQVARCRSEMARRKFLADGVAGAIF
jgi:hypothetical protein